MRIRLSNLSVQLNSMETPVISLQRNQHQDYGRNRSHIAYNFGPFGISPPSSGFRGINSRTFHSENGSRPMPLKSFSRYQEGIFCFFFSPRTPHLHLFISKKISKNNAKSISIPIKIEFENEERSFGDQLLLSVYCAGPDIPIHLHQVLYPCLSFHYNRKERFPLTCISHSVGLVLHIFRDPTRYVTKE